MKKKFVALCAATVLTLACVAGLVGCGQKATEASGETVSVTVAIESLADNAAFDAKSVTIDVTAEASVYDALVATGWDVDAEDTQYGKYVHGIDGNADGANWGWVYVENGEMAMDSADAHTVVADATYTWQMISW